MQFLKGLRGAVAFLTIMPVSGRETQLQDAALGTYLFPLVGAGIGLFTGLSAQVLMMLLPSTFIAAVLAVAILYLATGLHHFDGLLDLGDGLMLKGSPEERITAMRDKTTGAGGFGLGLMNTLLLVSCLWAVPADRVVPSLIAVEVSAKLSMVAGVVSGRPAPDGVGAAFIQSLKGRRGTTMLAASIPSLAIVIVALGMMGLLSVFSALLVGGVLVGLSHRSFRCVTGDVLGAMNELSRSISLLVLVALPWL